MQIVHNRSPETTLYLRKEEGGGGGGGERLCAACKFFRISCLSLIRVPESRVTRGSGFLGGGDVYSGGRCKEGCGLQKPRAVWSAV